MIFANVLYYFRARGIKQSLSKILYYDYKGYMGENPEVYFSTAKATAVHPQFTVENKTEEIPTDRPMVDNNILQLKENKDDTNITKNVGDNVLMTTNFDQPKDKHDGTIIHVAEPNAKLDNMMSIPDYEELSPKELLKYDNRTTKAYLIDMLIVEHSILSLVFRKSLKDPLFLRVLMLVFSLSMQFAFNALVYTDDVIDQRLLDKQNVSIY
jgi:hypothetical protein